MTDVLTPEQRRFNMSRIRGRDTGPEMIVRRALHAAGLRFRLHDRKLPGRPDLVFPRFRTVIFVHGCFWHAHGCRFSKLPQTRRVFWRDKIEGNTKRDREALTALLKQRWRVLIVWECVLRGGRDPAQRLAAIECTVDFLNGGNGQLLEIGANSSGKMLRSKLATAVEAGVTRQ